MYLEHLLLYAAIFGTFTSTIFFAMVLVAACRYVLQARKRRLQAKSFPERKFPAVTILKPVHGAEPRLEETLESFFRQDYPDFEIIFGARSRDNAAVAVVERLRAKYPHVPSKMIFSGEPSWPNAKVFSLAKMMAESENAFFAISDSDILVRPDFLRNVMPPLDDPRVGLVTCLYQGIPAPDFWSHLEALGMSVELPSGVMVADLVEGMKFALGASMVVRREAVAAIGGMREAADFYSDDFVLGNRVAEAGYEVVLSHYKVGHVLTAQTLRQTYGDQLRWMKSTRFSRPWGHVGSGLTYAVPFGVLALLVGLVHREWLTLGLGLLTIAWLNRMILALLVGWGIIRDRRSLWWSWLYPLRDLLGFCTWAGSFTSNKFFWRGESYKFGDEGRITPVHRSLEFLPDQVQQGQD